MKSEHLIDELSPKIRRFIEHNKEHGIIESTWLDKDGKEPSGGPDTWVKQRSRFEDGTVMMLSDIDLKAMLNAGFKPRWRGMAA